MRLLLINPKLPESFWSFKWAVDRVVPHARTLNPPLGLVTLAALCPKHWEVEIVDENIESIPLDPRADIVGICGMGVQFRRQKELLMFYRKKGYYTVAGGSYASLCPEAYEPFVDTVVAGEAEYIWKEFCQDFERLRPRRLYQETGVVNLEDSPVPRFDLLKVDKYKKMSLQFSRGCPFRCEFCDIIVMFGRTPRTKSVEQVEKELDLLRSLKVANAFFVDDNLIGNKQAAKQLLRFLRDYQHTHHYRFGFGTEASLNLAGDDELLHLFREANFEWVFIGIESPDEESLKETGKFQNAHQDILTSVRTIYSHGIQVFGGFIIGFDNDTLSSFDKQYRFVMDSGIQAAMIGLLMALPKTPLYLRLEKEGRLIPDANDTDNTSLGTNFIPKQMEYQEMVRAYHALYHRLLEDKNISTRIKNKIRYLIKPLYHGEYSFRESLIVLRNLYVRGLRPGGVSRMFHFLRSVPFLRPTLIPVVVQDWIVGLAMQNYVERHFISEQKQASDLATSYLGSIEKAFQRYVARGSLEVSLNQVKTAAANLSISFDFAISFKGWLDRAFYRRAARQLERLLEDTTSSLTLHIEEFHEAQLKYLNKFLKRLSRHGDRITISVHENLRDLVPIDSSIFNLVL
jgi:radical SAM superfamily enzyme YgiQ (UPF0313 family)